MEKPLKVVVQGAGGRMGKALLQAIERDPEIQLAGAVVPKGSPLLEEDIGYLIGQKPLGQKPVSDLALLSDWEVCIDFSSPKAALEGLALCQRHQKKMVIGTTGFSEEEEVQIIHASKAISLVYAPNMSVGITLCLQLLQSVSPVFGKEADIAVMEVHHRHKKDTPSGTARKMGEVIAQALKSEEKPNDPRIAFSSLRMGEAIGEHTALFAQAEESLEITHRAMSRRPFAEGALKAAYWLVAKAPAKGLYDMSHVLGFSPA